MSASDVYPGPTVPMITVGHGPVIGNPSSIIIPAPILKPGSPEETVSSTAISLGSSEPLIGTKTEGFGPSSVHPGTIVPLVALGY